MKKIKEMYKTYTNEYIGSGVYKHMTDIQKQRLEHAYAAGVKDCTKLFETIVQKQAG